MSITLVTSTLWCLLVFLCCTFAIPAWRSQSGRGLLDRVSRGGLAAGGFWVCTACFLGMIKCYNAITLTALAAGVLAFGGNIEGLPIHLRIIGWPERALGVWHRLLGWFACSPAMNLRSALRSRWTLRQTRILGEIPTDTLCLLALLVSVIVLSFCSHLVHWNNIRLVHSDEYLCLLRARQLLLNVDVTRKPLLFPAIVGSSALLSGADPLHVVRALAAIMPVLVTLATGRVAFLLTHSLLASSVAMYCENMALVRLVVLPSIVRALGPQPALADLLTMSLPSSLEAETGLFFLLLWMAVLLKRNTAPSGSAWYTAACGVALAASSFLLLLFAPFVGLACISKKSRGLILLLGMAITVLGIVIWQLQDPVSPVEALQYLPCLLALLVGMLVAQLEVVAVSFAGMQARLVVAAIVFALALLHLPPTIEGTQPLEYDSIARATNAISHEFAHQRWSIVAPVEQFAEVYSLGGFQDLAALVSSSATSGDISQAMMHNDGLDDLFIFVEKVPFTPFLKEPASVSFATLTDSTYRYYRSPAGRASLEIRAMQLCESYKKTHRNMSVFFEDDNVRVYCLHRLRDASATG